MDETIKSSVTLQNLKKSAIERPTLIMLCKTCTTIFQGREWDYHHSDPTALLNAAASGCYICEPLLRYGMKKYGTLEDCVAGQYRYRIYCPGNPTYSRSFFIIMKVLKDGEVTEVYQYFVAVSHSKLPMTTGVRNRKATIPLVEASGTAQRWLSECLDEHEKCRKVTKPQSYPTRLLELQEFTAKLILTGQVTPVSPYAALSYCWGLKPSFLCLTASNLKDLQAGVHYSTLPIAFQEAIGVLKSLSIRYLWIDCLCIIQSGPGSIEDWNLECAKMQDVYSNCILCLSLAQAKNPQQSCLNGYQLDTFLPFKIETTGLFLDDPSEKSSCTIVDRHYFRKGLYDQPIGFRAWCLQERFLAPRVLSIGHGELYWDCIELPHASESLPRGFANCPELTDLDLDLDQTAIPETSDRRILEEFWLALLEDYTDRELTSPETDKLVALSAIATRMSHAMDDVYIAGHFWKMLPLTLNWQVQPPLTEEKRRDKVPRRISHLAESLSGNKRSKTPSWSWASMNGPLFQQRNIDEKRDVVLVEANAFTLRLVDEKNPTGEVDCALLNIKAHCMEIEWRNDKPCTLEMADIWQGNQHYLDVNIDDPKDEPIDGARFLIAALVTAGFWNTLEGLVLKAVDMEGMEMYERIGHFIITSEDICEDFTVLFKYEKRVLTLN